MVSAVKPQFIGRWANADDATEFILGETITLFAGAHIYADRMPPLNPYHLLYWDHHLGAGSPPSGTEEERAQALSWDIFNTLKRQIDDHRIAPIKSAFWPDGTLNYYLTEIRTADLVSLAKERGEKPRLLQSLQPRQGRKPKTTAMKTAIIAHFRTMPLRPNQGKHGDLTAAAREIVAIPEFSQCPMSTARKYIQRNYNARPKAQK
jgi:hypothetical protein